MKLAKTTFYCACLQCLDFIFLNNLGVLFLLLISHLVNHITKNLAQPPLTQVPQQLLSLKLRKLDIFNVAQN